MTKKLRIAPNLTLPLDAATSTIVVYGGKGMGKCLGPEVEVLHYDGRATRADEVVVGDLLMGPDSRPRRVLSCSRGRSQMFTILPTKGAPWRCNDVHVLTLKESTTGEIVDVPLDEFLLKSRSYKQFHLLFSTGVDFAPAEPLPLDPYFLGLWYGDGDKGVTPGLGLVRVAVTTIDREVEDACREVADKFGLKVMRDTQETTKALTCRLVNDRGAGNPLLQLVRSIVGESLTVPHRYLVASRADRLAFLAGWMDSDGSLECGCFDFVQKRKDWADAVMFLARSLGFRATCSVKNVGDVDYYRVCLSGNVSEIPTRLAHKRASPRRQIKDHCRSGFRVIADGEGDYAGFELDGDGRFLLGDFTVTHNTNLATVLVEEFSIAGIRFAVIDPMGVWWGLRHSVDGKGKGIEVLILGGIHGDLPITPESGALVADLVVDEDASVVIDISRRADGSMWAISERVRFVRDYAKRIYQRQGEKRHPISQVIDEAARFAPQVVRQGENDVAACMGAIAVRVEEGRNVGIGVTLVTQRSARLNKDVAELADCMISFRIVGPNSMRAVLDWLGEHVEKARLKDISEKLRSLPRGSALVVSPGWLEFEGIVAMRKRTTFDSSATPKAGDKVRASGAGAKPDLSKYRDRLAELVEQQKANDPKVLRARVAELEKQLAKKKEGKVKTETVIEKVGPNKAVVAGLERSINGAEKLLDRTGKRAAQFTEAGALARACCEQLVESASKLQVKMNELIGVMGAANAPQFKLAKPPPDRRPVANRPITVSEPKPGKMQVTDSDLKPAHLRILSAIAWWESIGVREPDLGGVAVIAKTSTKSSAFDNNRARLRVAGHIDYPSTGRVRLTDLGRETAPPPTIPPTNEALQAAVFEMVTPAVGRLLHVLIDAYPNAVPLEDLAKEAGTSTSSSAFDNNRSWLRARGLAEYPRTGEAKATALLFPEGS